MAIDLDVNSFTELNNNIIDINNKTASLANMVLNPVPVGSTNKLAVKRGTTWNIEGEEAYNGRLQNFGDISGNISLDMDGAGCRTAMIAEVVGDTFITGFGDNFSSGVVYVLFLRQDSIGGHSVRWPYGASVLNMVGPDPNQITAVYVIKLPNGKIFVKCEAFQNTVEIGSILKEIEKPNIIYPVEGDSVSRTFEWQKEEPVFHGMVLSGLSSDWEVAKDELFLEIYFSSYDNTVHVFDLLTSVSWVGWSYFRTRYNGTIDGLPTSSLWSDSFSRFFGNTTEKDLPIFGKLSVVAITKVLDLTTNVGQAVAGSNGGLFTIASDGAWTFDPDGDFAALTGSETADTSVTYYASDGTSEAMATLTVAVTAGGYQPDEYWDSVSCLVQPIDGVIADAKGSTVSLIGDPGVIGQGMLFDGVDDVALVADSTNVELPSGAWTVDAWINVSSLPPSPDFITVLSKEDNAGLYFESYCIRVRDDGRIYAAINGSSTSSSTRKALSTASGVVVAGNDYHIEYSRDSSNVLRLFVNGSLLASMVGSTTPWNGNDPLRIAHRRQNSTINALFNGTIYSIRITKGVCRHTSDFTPPPYPFPTS